MTRSPNSNPALWKQQAYDHHNSPISDPTHNHNKMPMRAATIISQSSDQSSKRMSRASKKTPTKYLNATVNNFKSLVHRHTACPPMPFSIFGGSGKYRGGPVTLCFDQGLGNYHQEQAELIPAYTNQVVLSSVGVTGSAQINATPSTCGADEEIRQPPAVESTAASSAGAAGLEEFTGQENGDDDGSDWFDDFVAEFFSADGIL